MSNVVQSEYNRYMSAGVEGAAASTRGWDADTKQAEGNITFGKACSKGEADDGAVLGGTNFIGISIRDITLVHTTADRYEEGDNMAVLNRGDIWVRAGADVTAGAQGRYDTSTGVISDSGGTAIAGSKFMTSGSSGDLVVLRLGTASEDLST